MKNFPLWAKCLLLAIACVVLGGLSGVSTAGSIQEWYTTLNKPSWNPPNWIFGPVWTLLYSMMGIAAAIVWHKNVPTDSRMGLLWFAVQFALNLAWTPIFFGMHQLGFALVVIILMWLAILITIFKFANVSKLAAWLLVPYISWVSFATILNATLLYLNS